MGKSELHGTSGPVTNCCWKQRLRLGYPGHCQAKSWIFSERKDPQPLWEACYDAQLFSGWKITIFLILKEFPLKQVVPTTSYPATRHPFEESISIFSTTTFCGYCKALIRSILSLFFCRPNKPNSFNFSLYLIFLNFFLTFLNLLTFLCSSPTLWWSWWPSAGPSPFFQCLSWAKGPNRTLNSRYSLKNLG